MRPGGGSAGIWPRVPSPQSQSRFGLGGPRAPEASPGRGAAQPETTAGHGSCAALGGSGRGGPSDLLLSSSERTRGAWLPSAEGARGPARAGSPSPEGDGARGTQEPPQEETFTCAQESSRWLRCHLPGSPGLWPRPGLAYPEGSRTGFPERRGQDPRGEELR